MNMNATAQMVTTTQVGCGVNNTKKRIIELILSQLMAARKDGGAVIYFDALTGREDSVDWETFGDLVDALIKKTR
jgi:hypothetical protein